MEQKFNKLKSPIYLIGLNWIIFIIINHGIPLLAMDSGSDMMQQYVISFLGMSFNLFGDSSKFIPLLISWIISLAIFAIFSKNEYRIPLYCIITELIISIFCIIFFIRHSPNTFANLRTQLLMGIAVTLLLISSLFLTTFVKRKYKKTPITKKYPSQYKKLGYITKCPHCGTEYDSKPEFCYVCSKKISE